MPEKRLPRSALEKEIDRIRDLDVTFRMNTEVGRDIAFKELLDRFDAVVIASGAMKPETEKAFGVEVTKQGIHINRSTFETSVNGVFAGGSAVRPHRIAARAVADGRSIARSVCHYLEKKEVSALDKKFDCRMGTLHDGELNEFLKGALESKRTRPSGGALSGFSFDEAMREAQRCLHCDCGGKHDCMLRDYADAYGAVQKHNTVERIRFERITEHPSIVFEPSKCIKCGSCVRISAAEDEPFGLSFSDRSFNLKVTVPFGESLSRGLEKSALRCARACPTGALTEKLETTKDENRKAP
jgi:ferredoxin